jgi:hypothetical protein
VPVNPTDEGELEMGRAVGRGPGASARWIEWRGGDEDEVTRVGRSRAWVWWLREEKSVAGGCNALLYGPAVCPSDGSR